MDSIIGLRKYLWPVLWFATNAIKRLIPVMMFGVTRFTKAIWNLIIGKEIMEPLNHHKQNSPSQPGREDRMRMI